MEPITSNIFSRINRTMPTWARHFICLTLIMLIGMPANAVLKEKNLDKTIGVLRHELENAYNEQKDMMKQYEQSSAVQHEQLINYMQQSEQISLILYSQKHDFTFDVAYACSEASQLHRRLRFTSLPYDKIRDRIMGEIARYDSLIISLKELPPSINDTDTAKTAEDKLIEAIPDSILTDTVNSKVEEPFLLSQEEQDDRNQCLIYAKALRNNLVRILNSIEKDRRYYSLVTEKVTNLYKYTQKRYDELQTSIFKDGTNNYFKVLAKLPRQLSQAKKDIETKYKPLGNDKRSKSEWRGPIVLAVSVFMLIYIFIATLLSNILLRLIPFIFKKCFQNTYNHIHHKINEALGINDEGQKKLLGLLTLAVGVAIFAIALTIVKQFMSFNLLIMASTLMIDFAWLIEAILISLLIRLKPEQAHAGINIYMSFLWMALVIIFFRIVLIPNNLVNLICPPLLLGFTIWQYLSIRKCKDKLPVIDLLYSSISLIVMIVSTCCSWAGYTLLAVQIIIWWTFQLAAIQTITCCYDMIQGYEKNVLYKKIIVNGNTLSEKKKLYEKIGSESMKKALKNGKYIQRTWFYDLCVKTLIPIAAVVSVLASIYWAADIFEMTSKCISFFQYKFIDEKDVIQLSVAKICLVAVVFYVFRYLNYIISSLYLLYRHHQTEENGNGDYNETLARNVIAIIVWGIFVIFSLVLMKVPRSGIEIVGAGLATGMGFAMKDLLENFIYGISLMTGRLRVGDYIECDGIQGKVESITYQSTQIITLDGSVIAFLNASLFNKNFKNLTRNHSYELVKVPIGVAYGSNVAQVRTLLLDAIMPLCEQTVNGCPIVSPGKKIDVLLSQFGDSSVDLDIILWPLVEKKVAFTAQVREVIYTTLNENNIEIPFPQRDINIRSIANESTSKDNSDAIK